MDERNDITQMLAYLPLPGFCVQEQKITALNAAAKGLLLEPGTDISELLLTGRQEYAAFTGGCLYLTLSIGGKPHGATVTRIADTHIFALEQDQEPTELHSLALAARELREPLNNIMIAANRLAGNPDPQLRKQISQLNRGLYQLHRILGNMSHASGCPSCPELWDINALLEELCAGAAGLMQHTGITLTYTGLPKPVYTLADRSQLERAVLNMLSNALKFTPQGGAVEVRLTRTGKMLSVSVLDNGSSIADHILKNLFSRYLRPAALEDPRFGIGLGMVLIRNAAALHGGTVLVDRPGETGTRVTMTLAIRQSPNTQLRSPILPVDYAGGRDHALLEFSETLPAELYEKE